MFLWQPQRQGRNPWGFRFRSNGDCSEHRFFAIACCFAREVTPSVCIRELKVGLGQHHKWAGEQATTFDYPRDDIRSAVGGGTAEVFSAILCNSMLIVSTARQTAPIATDSSVKCDISILGTYKHMLSR